MSLIIITVSLRSIFRHDATTWKQATQVFPNSRQSIKETAVLIIMAPVLLLKCKA